MAFGIEAFVRDDGGSTTIAAAVAIIVSLVLVFGLANVAWVTSRSADVQAVADAGALAAMNVLGGYVTAAQLVDALVLSLGLVGILCMAIGLVMSAIPGLDAVGPPVISAARTVFEARASLAKSAAVGLERLEAVVPYLMAANSFVTIRANAGEECGYVGVAIPFPHEGETDFGTIRGDDLTSATDKLVGSGERIDELSSLAEGKKKEADGELERAWRADCGDDVCMRERAGSLAGLAGALNPNYPTTDGWDFPVAIERARSYYQLRLAQEAPSMGGAKELARSCARRAFYEYALGQVGASSFVRAADGTVSADLRELPSNTDEVRATSLYTDACWPCTQQEDSVVVHASLTCPGATGPAVGVASLAQVEDGSVGVCPECEFTVVDVGRAPAASTSIDNGFEHYWREVVRASEAYEAARNAQASLEEQAKHEGETATSAFSDAISKLAMTRLELKPPGRHGCVCIVFDSSAHAAPAVLETPVSTTATLPPRMAVSAAILARDKAGDGNTVLSAFFDGLVAQGGLAGATGDVLDALMTSWGDMLLRYGDGYDALSNGAEESFDKLAELGFGNAATWLRGALTSAIDLAGIAPTDLSAKKPVLVNTADVMEKEGNDWYAIIQQYIMHAPRFEEATTPSALLSAFGVYVESVTGSDKVTVAEVPIPGTEMTIPIEIDFEWLSQLVA